MDNVISKLIRDYRYNLETLYDVKEISSIAENEFRDALNEEDPDAMKALMGDGSSKKEEEDEKPSIDCGPKFKKLFRKAVVKCHPDKISDNVSERESLFLKKCYENLTESNDNGDWGLLLTTCLDLDVEFIELGDEEINNIKSNTDKLRSEISKYENSMAYSWFNQNDENAKIAYLAECAKIFRNSLGI